MRSSKLSTLDPDHTLARVGLLAARVPSRLAAGALTAPTGPPARRVTTHAALVAGAGLVASSALIHLHLWADGYRNVSTIGPLFVGQGIVGLVLALALIAYPRMLTAGAGAAYLLASVAALSLSATRGFLGFMDTLDAPWATTTLIVESAGAFLLVIGGALAFRRH